MNKIGKVTEGRMRKAISSIVTPVQNFIKLEASSGIFLFVVAIIAMITANSENLKDIYFSFIK